MSLPHGRRPVALVDDRGLEPATKARRARAFAALLAFAAGADAAVLRAGSDAREIDRILGEYGQHRYEHEVAGPQPFVDAIQGCTDVHRHLRRQLPRAWDAVTAWQALEPSDNRTPLPLLLFRALVALAFAWGWQLLAVTVTLGFHAALRPGELLALRVADVLLPEALLHGMAHGFVVLTSPKTRKTFAQRQHVRVDDPLVLALLRAAVRGRDPAAYVWPALGSPAARARRFRKFWDLLVASLGCPEVLPSGIRAGAITWFYDRGMPLADIQWVGRWACPRTLSKYIQEVAAVRVIARLHPGQRDRLAQAAQVAEHLASVWAARTAPH